MKWLFKIARARRPCLYSSGPVLTVPAWCNGWP